MKVYKPLELQPINFDEACVFVNEHHRHHIAPQGHKFSIAVSSDGSVIGVAIVGRPVARLLDNGWTLEVTRLCTVNGYPNAASMLYRACWKAAKAMGYKRLITYILDTESGTSLKAAGFSEPRELAKVGGGTWDRKERPRIDKHPTQQKRLFEFRSVD